MPQGKMLQLGLISLDNLQNILDGCFGFVPIVYNFFAPADNFQIKRFVVHDIYRTFAIGAAYAHPPDAIKGNGPFTFFLGQGFDVGDIPGLDDMNFTFRGFWSGIKLTKYYMYVLVSMHAVNIFLNYALISGNFGFYACAIAGNLSI